MALVNQEGDESSWCLLFTGVAGSELVPDIEPLSAGDGGGGRADLVPGIELLSAGDDCPMSL